MILPAISTESPRSKNTVQKVSHEMKHWEKLLGIFVMWLGSLSSQTGYGELPDPGPPLASLLSRATERLGERDRGTKCSP